MMLKGRVVSGNKRGAYFVSQYAERLSHLLGFQPFPGTLNIELPGQPRLPAKSFFIPSWSDKSKDYGAVWAYPAVLKNAPVTLLVPEKTQHAPNIIEIISPLCLRSKLGIKDGDYVEVEIEEAKK